MEETTNSYLLTLPHPLVTQRCEAWKTETREGWEAGSIPSGSSKCGKGSISPRPCLKVQQLNGGKGWKNLEDCSWHVLTCSGKDLVPLASSWESPRSMSWLWEKAIPPMFIRMHRDATIFWKKLAGAEWIQRALSDILGMEKERREMKTREWK